MDLNDLLKEAESIASRAFNKPVPSPSPVSTEAEVTELGLAYLAMSVHLREVTSIMVKHQIPGNYQIALVTGWVLFFAALMTRHPWAIELSERVKSGEFGTTDSTILPVVLETVIANTNQ